jgi:hypothetical protein
MVEVLPGIRPRQASAGRSRAKPQDRSPADSRIHREFLRSFSVLDPAVRSRADPVFSPFFHFLTLPPPIPENDPMAVLGRLGQFLGLSIPAVAILLELNHAITLGQMLVMLVAALCCFWIGRIVEAYTRR